MKAYAAWQTSLLLLKNFNKTDIQIVFIWNVLFVYKSFVLDSDFVKDIILNKFEVD